MIQDLGSTKDNIYITYIIKCADGSYYTGYTADLKQRLKKHNQGKAAKYTRGRTPVSLVYKEEHGSKSRAMQREYQIKQLTRIEKEKLIKEN
ncbi:MAG TPA: GIY-YIG nuclease family protein [Halanaerobiales bacterium]|nr:GIY-YIG nuclease family protein [Halanaerobiales bacterium]